MSDTKYDRETILDAIRGEGRWAPTEPGKITNSFGNITIIAQRLQVSRNTVYAYARKWSTIDEAIKEGREALGDFVENKMAQKMLGGDTTMIIFYAKTQLRGRGYVERHEWSGPDGGEIPIRIVGGVNLDDV